MEKENRDREADVMTTLDLLRDIVSEDELVANARVSSKGQIVIPVDIRRAAGLESGNSTVRCVYRDGHIILEKQEYLSPDELCGFFNKAEDEGNYTLDLNAAREERAAFILNKDL